MKSIKWVYDETSKNHSCFVNGVEFFWLYADSLRGEEFLWFVHDSRVDNGKLLPWQVGYKDTTVGGFYSLEHAKRFCEMLAREEQ